MPTIVTGPTTHQSPLTNWPDSYCWSKLQVIPYWLIEAAATPPPGSSTSTSTGRA